jgi:hypothetical protein
MASVIITPIDDPTFTPPVEVPGTVVPELNYWYDQPLFGKPRACIIRQNYNPLIQMQLVTPQGEAVTLEATPLLRFCEASLAINKKANGTVTVDDATYGVISFRLPSSIRNTAGIYLAEVGVVEDNNLVFCNEIYIYVERSSFGNTPYGPPNVDTLRVSLGDSDQNESELLSTNMYSTTDIAASVVRAIQFWNDLPPSSRTFRYSTLNFPHQSLLIEGAQAFLFQAVVEQFRKNRLPYQAGGIALDDQNKIQEYHTASIQMLQSFREQAINLKAQMNVNRGFAYY